VSLRPSLTFRRSQDVRARRGPHHQGPTKTPKLDLHTSHTPIAIVESLLLLLSPTMVAPEVNHLFHHPIADHSFSADRQTLAVARENNVDLYAKEGSAFKLQDELTGHDKTVTGVDIAPNSGKIVTCSQGESGALR
jgi:WD40 repeat protein